MAPKYSPTPTQQQQIGQLQQQVQKLQLDRERENKRSLANSNLAVFEHTVLARAEDWQMTARNIGTAYSQAAARHRAAIKEEDNHDAINASFFFSTLSVLSAGALTWVWEAKKLVRMGEVLGPVLKDTLAGGLGKGFDNAALLSPPTPNRDAVSKEPLEFQNGLENRVSEYRKRMYEFMAKAHDMVRTIRPDAWDNATVDRFRTMADEWEKQSNGLGALAEEAWPIDRMADEFERGFWQRWIGGLITGEDDQLTNGEYTRWNYEAIHTGGAVAGRLEALGILREAGITIKRSNSAKKEDRALVAWADRYRPQPFAAV